MFSRSPALSSQMRMSAVVVMVVMSLSPLRAPGAASGRVVSAVSVTTCIHYLHLDGGCKPPRSLFLRPRSIFPEAEQLGEIPGQGVVGARRRAERLDPVADAIVARHDAPNNPLRGRAQWCQGGAPIGRQGATEERGGRVGGRPSHQANLPRAIQRRRPLASSTSASGAAPSSRIRTGPTRVTSIPLRSR